MANNAVIPVDHTNLETSKPKPLKLTLTQDKPTSVDALLDVLSKGATKHLKAKVKFMSLRWQGWTQVEAYKEIKKNDKKFKQRIKNGTSDKYISDLAYRYQAKAILALRQLCRTDEVMVSLNSNLATIAEQNLLLNGKEETQVKLISNIRRAPSQINVNTMNVYDIDKLLVHNG